MKTVSRLRQISWGMLCAALAFVALNTDNPLSAHSIAPLQGRDSISVADIVNADGTLNLDKDVVGTLAFAGWHVSLDPVRGPVFALAQDTRAIETGNSHRHQLVASAPQEFSPIAHGVGGDVNAIAIRGKNVFVAGSFVHTCGNAACNAGNLVVNRIARWNGSAWFPLANGMNGIVTALAVKGKELYAGGLFTAICGNSACSAGNVRAYRVAKWNGSSWSPLADGVNDNVSALALRGNELYVGGLFTEVCGNNACNSGNVKVNRIAKWNGSNWSALGNGVDQNVIALTANANHVFVGGAFTQLCGNSACNAGNVTVNRTARWDGANWSPLGSGMNNSVYTLALKGSELYVGGGFTAACGNSACNAGNIRAHRIAKWDGNNWSALANGVNEIVVALAISGSDVYVGGFFTHVCGDHTCLVGNIPVNRAARWNGASWTGLGNGLNHSIWALGIGRSNVYAGGEFAEICGNLACNIGNTKANQLAAHPCESKPVKPKLKHPANNSIVGTNRPVLKWNAASCANTYTVLVRVATTNLVAAKAKGLTKLKYMTAPLPGGAQYKWFVKACNLNGCRKSAARFFTVP